MPARGRTYEQVCQAFRWEIPERFNIATAVCDRHVGGRREAIVHEHQTGQVERYTFEALKDLSSRLANALTAHGIARGDRVAVLLPQCVETVVTHLAAYRIGAVALPLFFQFGPDALEYRLSDSGTRAVVTNDAGLARLAEIRDRLSELRLIVNIDPSRDVGAVGFQSLVERGAPEHDLVATSADDPALMLYTSGTTGQPKGVLHGHRVLLGHLPGVELPHDFFPQPGDRMWTPADWAWIGGLLDVLLPSLFHGVPVVAYRFPKFDPDRAFDLMARHRVRNAFMPPTSLKMMRQVTAPSAMNGALRSIASGGERLGEELCDWGRRTFGLTINEFYGQTEANLLVGNSGVLMPTYPGSMGRAIPGHEVAVVDEEGLDRSRRPGRDDCGQGAGPRDVPRVLAQSGRDAGEVPRVVVRDGRHGPPRRARLLLVRGARRRRDQYVGVSRRSGGNRRLPDAASGGRPGCGDRRAGRRPGRGGQGLRRPAAGRGRRRRTCIRDPGVREEPAVGP